LPISYRNIHLIYNPTAGRLQRSGESAVERLVEILERQGAQVTPAPTAGPRDARRLARRAVEENADLVLVAGGDGTINEALNGLVHSTVPMAAMPLGTANVLAVELGMAGAPERVAASIPDLVPERVAVGHLRSADQERYFLMMAGAGVDAHIVAHVDPELKKRLGKLAYWIGGFTHLGVKFPEFEVLVDGRTLRSCFTLAARVRNYGGDLEIAKTACLLDDYFEVVVFEGDYSFRYLKYFTGVLANLLDHMEGVHICKAKRVEFRPPPEEEVFVQVDGEFAGRLPAVVELVPSALTLLVPQAFREKFSECRDAASGAQ